MDDPPEDSEKINIIKIATKDAFQQKFKEIEVLTGRHPPKEFVTLVNSFIENISPSTRSETIQFMKEFPRIFKELLNSFKIESEGLTPECKGIIERLIDSLFKVTEGKGIENRLWTHFPKIWSFYRVSKGLDKIGTTPEKLDSEIFQVQFLYVSFYELTLQILTEFAVTIALKKRIYDGDAKIFLKLYQRDLKRGRTITKHDLITFLKKEKFLSTRPCNILENSRFRDKPSHANAYFDAESQKIVLGSEEFEIDEFKNLYGDLFKFYCYLVWIYLDHTQLLALINQIEEFARKIPDMKGANPNES